MHSIYLVNLKVPNYKNERIMCFLYPLLPADWREVHMPAGYDFQTLSSIMLMPIPDPVVYHQKHKTVYMPFYNSHSISSHIWVRYAM